MKVGQSLDLPREITHGIYEKITEDFPDVGVSWFYDEFRYGICRLLTEFVSFVTDARIRASVPIIKYNNPIDYEQIFYVC